MRAVFVIVICLFGQNILSADLSSSFEKLKNKYKNYQLGVEIISASDGKQIAAINSDKKLNPASTIKILTAAAAFDYLRPEFVYKTKFFYDGILKDGILKGNVYAVASGDPVFVTENMYLVVDEIARKGVKIIKGDIIVDDSVFNMSEDENERVFKENRAYNALISPIVFNFNTTTFYITPGETVGKPLNIIIDPENTYLRVDNQTKTGKDGITLSIDKKDFDNGAEAYLVRGSLPIGASEQRYFKKIENPSAYFAHVFKDFLLNRGIQVEGKLKKGKAKASLKELASSESRPLSIIIKDLFTFSNNLVAENIVRTIGSKSESSNNSLQEGLKIISDYAIQKAKMNKTEFFINSGSGLSRENQISASALNKVMFAALKDFTIAPEFVSAFCVSGVTGTIKSRFKKQLKEKIRAKTGSLDGVASLAGLYDGKKEKYIFTIFVNSASADELRGIVDAIINAMGEYL